MARDPKCAEVVAWRKLPTEFAPAWYTLPFSARALGTELFRVFGRDPIPAPRDCLGDVLCSRLAISGRERKNARAAIDRILAAGLLVETETGWLLLYCREAVRTQVPTSPRDLANTRAGSEPTPQPEGPARDHSGPAPQKKEERNKKEQVRARSREKDAEPPKLLSESGDVRRVFEKWVELFWPGRGPRPKLTNDRRAKVKARLREGFTADQLIAALEGATTSSFHVEGGYTGLETLLKNAGAVERHLGRATGAPKHIKRRHRTADDLPRASDGGIV